jgi:hypothetical protein
VTLPTLLLLIVGGAEVPADAVTQCRGLLDDGNYWRCVAVAKASFEGGDEKAGPLLAALLDAASQFSLAARVRRKLGADTPASDVALPAVRVKGGDAAFVGASRLVLRAEPAYSGKALVSLDINTPLQVQALEGDWAKVQISGVGGTRFVFANPLGAERLAPQFPESPAAVATGYVAAAYLETRPIDLVPLLKRASETPQPAEATKLWERASALHPADKELLRKLVGSALDAQLFVSAAHAAYVLAGYTYAVANLEVEALEIVYGCRGDLTKADSVAVTGSELGSKPASPDSCAVGVLPWPPCPACAKGPKPPRKAAAKAQKARDAFEERQAKIDALYPSEPWLHVRLRNRTGLATDPTTFFVVATVAPDGCAVFLKPPPGNDLVRIGLVDVPSLGLQEAVDFWIPAPQYRSRTYSIVSNLTADQAKTFGIDQKRADWNEGAPLSDPPKAVRTVRIEGDPCCCP